MAGASKIEWTEATWNPVAGCSVVSPGCTNCYAMRRVAPRLSANPATPHYAGTVMTPKAGAVGRVAGAPGGAEPAGPERKKKLPVWTGKIGIAGDQVLLAPLRWRRPRMIFVNSTSDLFHPGVPDAVIDRVFAVMALCPQHTFQVLTKRPERMHAYLTAAGYRDGMMDACNEVAELAQPGSSAPLARHWANWYSQCEGDKQLPNVWLGTSVEDQIRADERIPHLLATPAAVRFISAEPLLGPIDVAEWLHDSDCRLKAEGICTCAEPREDHLGWVIVGGESGSGARPMHPDWARALRDQCAAAGVPFFFKQWGEWAPGEWVLDLEDRCRFLPMDDRVPVKGLGDHERAQHRVHFWEDDKVPEGLGSLLVGKHAAGRLLDGVEHNAMPAVGTGSPNRLAERESAPSRDPLGQRVGQE